MAKIRVRKNKILNGIPSCYVHMLLFKFNVIHGPWTTGLGRAQGKLLSMYLQLRDMLLTLLGMSLRYERPSLQLLQQPMEYSNMLPRFQVLNIKVQANCLVLVSKVKGVVWTQCGGRISTYCTFRLDILLRPIFYSWIYITYNN